MKYDKTSDECNRKMNEIVSVLLNVFENKIHVLEKGIVVDMAIALIEAGYKKSKK